MSLVQTFERLLPKGPFARGVTVLVSGTAGGQAIVILALPILTRLYTPAQFGVLAVYASLLGIITVVAGLRYELAIPLPRNDARAANILALALGCVVGVTGVSALLVALLGHRIVASTNTPELEAYLWLLPLGVALAGAYQTFSYWAIRSKAFDDIARTKVQQGGAMVIAQITIGLLHVGAGGLLLGHIIGQSAGLFGLYRVFRNRKTARTSAWSTLHVLAVAKRYRRFPAYTSWAGLLNATGNQLPPIVLAAFFSPVAAGLYMIAYRVGSQPLTLIGRAIAQVFFSSAAIARRQGDLGILTSKAFRTLLRVGTLPIALLAFTAPPLFQLVFGPDWVEAGVYLQWLAPWLIAQFVFSPLSSLSLVLERQPYELLLESTLLFVRLLAFWAGVFWDSAQLSLGFFGLLSAAVFFPYGAWVCHLAGADIRRLFLDVIKEIVIVAGVLVAIFVISRLADTVWRGEQDHILVIAVALGVPLLLLNIKRIVAAKTETGNGDAVDERE